MANDGNGFLFIYYVVMISSESAFSGEAFEAIDNIFFFKDNNAILVCFLLFSHLATGLFSCLSWMVLHYSHPAEIIRDVLWADFLVSTAFQ